MRGWWCHFLYFDSRHRPRRLATHPLRNLKPAYLHSNEPNKKKILLWSVCISDLYFPFMAYLFAFYAKSERARERERAREKIAWYTNAAPKAIGLLFFASSFLHGIKCKIHTHRVRGAVLVVVKFWQYVRLVECGWLCPGDSIPLCVINRGEIYLFSYFSHSQNKCKIFAICFLLSFFFFFSKALNSRLVGFTLAIASCHRNGI